MAQAAEKEETNELGDGIARNAAVASAGVGGLGAVGAVATNAQNANWFMRALSGGNIFNKPPTLNPMDALTQGNVFTGVIAAVAAVPDAIEAVQELAEGDIAGAGRKVVRAAANAAIAFIPAAAIVDLGTQLVTGKRALDHFGDLANNVTDHFTGGDKDKSAKAESAINVPATVAVGAGVTAAGLAAHHYISEKGNNYTLGGLPDANPVDINAPAALKGVPQVMNASHPREIAIEQTATAQRVQEEEKQQPVEEPRAGMPTHYWRNKIGQEKQRALAANQNAAAPSAAIPAPTSDDGEAYKQLAAQLKEQQGMSQVEKQQARAEQGQLVEAGRA